MTTPVAFTALPRVSATDFADVPPAQARLATAMDANFAKVNPYAAGFGEKFKVRRVTGSSLLTFASNWTWYTGVAETNVVGWYIGDLRSLSVLVKYTGPTLTADGYGGLTDLNVATLKDTRFLVGGSPAQQTCLQGCYSYGTAGVAITQDGRIVIIALSYASATLASGQWFGFQHTYLVR